MLGAMHLPGWAAPSSPGTEILEQGVEGEFLLDANVAVPHAGGEFRVSRRRRRLASELGERRE